MRDSLLTEILPLRLQEHTTEGEVVGGGGCLAGLRQGRSRLLFWTLSLSMSKK